MTPEPLLPAGHTCFLLRGALNPAECEAVLQQAEVEGFEAMGHKYPRAYRCNDRLVRDDPALAAWLWQRLGAQLPTLSGARPLGLNPRFRFCRYRDGQSFCLHRDGAWSPSPTTRTRLTLQLYLNDGCEFEGGETRFSEGALEVRPERGMAIVFDHSLWHAGQPVPRGTKYVLRSDVIYPLPTPAPSSIAHSGLLETARYESHLGYVWQALPLRNGLIASGSRDGTVRLWPSGDVVVREPSSIVALAEKSDGRLVHGTREQGVLCLTTLGNGSVAAGMSDGTLRLGERTLELSAGWLWCVTESAPGRVIVGADTGELIEVDVQSLRVIRRQQLPSAVRSLTQLSDSSLLAGLSDGKLWHDGSLSAAHTGAITGVVEVGAGLWATSSEDCSIGIWAAQGCRRVGCATHDDFVRSVAVAGGELVTASYDCSVRRWALA